MPVFLCGLRDLNILFVAYLPIAFHVILNVQLVACQVTSNIMSNAMSSSRCSSSNESFGHDAILQQRGQELPEEPVGSKASCNGQLTTDH